jgi:hypothetical protein
MSDGNNNDNTERSRDRAGERALDRAQAQAQTYRPLYGKRGTSCGAFTEAGELKQRGGADTPPAAERQLGGLTDNNPKAARALLDGKAPLEQLILSIFAGAARVMAGGAVKYGVRNWRREPISASTYEGALMRHFSEWQDGHDVDKDSGEHPFSHMIATCMIVLDAIEQGTFVDDRERTEIVNKELDV